ncbi:TetR/AcrR family transcriptional regulator [Novosphingobium sp.]|jgi:AcrR family transcriptional regulator|uniref:TetR/AcrR family transcriptional regulator n=1 Tax=Novosphingobium sp. TaxID=1874826 RepID=UPI001ECF854F|nr:TetR/AcrR family transcriptional regulator [Novosphingobium sp.]MBK6799938.1 TetR/AcrR family transcriptional regulator [Novosphingobium sp.]MBK9011046.1 TetR/AcrR family transcriptional regulator [Novosphingobium sp.]
MASRTTDKRSAATRLALIETAERLIAGHGLDGISLRQIAAEAGCANTNAVAYHFGSKEALVEAVIRHRVPALEARRGELLAGQDEAGLNAMCDALWRPFFEQVDAAGHHSYAAFLTGLFRSGALPLRAAMSADYPVTEALLARIAAALPRASAGLLPQRLALVTLLITGALRLIDESGPGPDAAEHRFADAVAMSAAALAAPPQNHNGTDHP